MPSKGSLSEPGGLLAGRLARLNLSDVGAKSAQKRPAEQNAGESKALSEEERLRRELQRAEQKAEAAVERIGEYTEGLLYQDMFNQLRTTVQASTGARRQAQTRVKLTEDGVTPVAFEDIDVALPYDRWNAATLSSPTALRSLRQSHATQEMGFLLLDSDSAPDPDSAFLYGNAPVKAEGESEAAWRRRLKQNLYRFGISTSFAEPAYAPTGGVAVFGLYSMQMQPRSNGVPLAGPGRFLRLCESRHAEDPSTKEPLLEEGASRETSANWKEYARASKYRVEVGRLWWKLWMDMEPAVRGRLMVEAGVAEGFQTSDKVKEKKLRALDELRLQTGAMVLSVTELGRKGMLPIGTIEPEFEQRLDGNARPYYVRVGQEVTDPNAPTVQPQVDPDAPEVQLKNSMSWPVEKIEKKPRWLRWLTMPARRNIIALDVLQGLFGDDVAREVALEKDEELPQLDGARTPAETRANVDYVLTGIVATCPVWAQAYLSLHLVDDPQLLADDSAEAARLQGIASDIDADAARTRRTIAKSASEGARRQHELRLEAQLAEASRLRGEAAKTYRDRDAASFQWNAYAGVSKTDWNLEDFKAGGSVTWAVTQLHRCVREVDTRAIYGGTEDFHYALGPKKVFELAPEGVLDAYGKRDIVEKATLKPLRNMARVELRGGAEEAASFYASWHIEVVQKKGIGNVGQIATLVDMMDFAATGSSRYAQLQGRSGVITRVQPNPDQSSSYPFLLTLRVDGFKYSDKKAADEAAGVCEEDGTALVTVNNKHVWPLEHSMPIRYGDLVTLRISKESHPEFGRVFAVVRRYWTPEPLRQATLSDEDFKTVRGWYAYNPGGTTLDELPSFQVVHWKPEVDEVVKEERGDGMQVEKAYRNLDALLYDGSKAIRRAPFEPEGALQSLKARLVEKNFAVKLTKMDRDSAPIKAKAVDGDMENFETGPPSEENEQGYRAGLLSAQDAKRQIELMKKRAA